MMLIVEWGDMLGTTAQKQEIKNGDDDNECTTMGVNTSPEDR